MSNAEIQPVAPPPQLRWYQFSLRTLLLVFVVLASSLAVFGSGGIVVFVLVGGLALCIARALLSYFLLLVLCLLPVVRVPSFEGANRELARRMTCQNNLQQIINAVHQYEAKNGCYPPAYVSDKDGKPMYSWRVLILPFLDQLELYNSFNLSEPWDGPNNKKLLSKCPKIYLCPSDPPASMAEAQTSYVAVVGPNAAWYGEKPRTLGPADFPGGSEHTIMLVEAADSGIEWSEPRDLSLAGLPEGKPPAIAPTSRHRLDEGFFYSDADNIGTNVAVAIGRITWLPHLSPEALRKSLTVGGFNDRNLESSNQINFLEIRLHWANIAALCVWLVSAGVLIAIAIDRRKLLLNSKSG